MSAHSSLLALELRDERASAIARVRRALERSTTLVEAARRLSVPYRTLTNWVDPHNKRGIPAVCKLADELGMRGRGLTTRRRSHKA